MHDLSQNCPRLALPDPHCCSLRSLFAACGIWLEADTLRQLLASPCAKVQFFWFRKSRGRIFSQYHLYKWRLSRCIIKIVGNDFLATKFRGTKIDFEIPLDESGVFFRNLMNQRNFDLAGRGRNWYSAIFFMQSGRPVFYWMQQQNKVTRYN